MNKEYMQDSGNSVNVYENIKKDAEPTGSDIASKTSKGPDISSASNSSIPQPNKKSNSFDEKSSDKQYALPLDEDGISGAEVLSWFENKNKSANGAKSEPKNINYVISRNFM